MNKESEVKPISEQYIEEASMVCPYECDSIRRVYEMTIALELGRNLVVATIDRIFVVLLLSYRGFVPYFKSVLYTPYEFLSLHSFLK